MILKETRFNNFRCFKDYEIKYGSQTTVFIGKNGTGKSSVLSGIRRGLSFMFARSKNFEKNLATSNNAKVRSFSASEANFDPISRVYNYPIENNFTAQFEGEILQWAMVKMSQNGGYITTRYQEVLNVVLAKYNKNLRAELPVLAVITDSFPHEVINFGSKAKKTVGSDILPRDLGYYGWDERTSCIELWLNRFYKVSNFEKDLNDEIRAVETQIKLWETRAAAIEEGNAARPHSGSPRETLLKLNERITYLRSDERSAAFTRERQFIENKLMEFTKPISDNYRFINQEFELFRIAVNRPDKKSFELEFNFQDGRVVSFDTLPMGYKRVFSIVLDIAYRSYILNEAIDSPGIVLIDELELHLHPTLQQDVLQRLRNTFPNIQFIITTHSPLIISNFKSNDNNKLIRLDHDGNEYSQAPLDNIFGIDYNTGLTEIMGAAYRESQLDKLIDSVVILTKFDKLDQAKKVRKELAEIVGDNNTYIDEEIKKRIAKNR